MKKLFTAIAAIVLSLGMSSCKNKENKEITKWLSEIYTAQQTDSLFADEWVYKHCSQHMQDVLQDEYDFECNEPPCWGSWIIGGWGDGEDMVTTLDGITFDGTYYYATLLPDASYAEDVTGKRVIRFKVDMIDGVPVIDECTWTQNFTMTRADQY